MARRGSVKTTVTDYGAADIKRAIESMRGSVKAGVLESAGTHKDADGNTVAQIALWNEFGTQGRTSIPERPALRTATAKFQQILKSATPKLHGDVLSGKLSFDKMLDILGLKIVAIMKKEITDWKSPPNAPSTIARKARKTGRAAIASGAASASAYDNPLIDTGQYRNSINYEKTRK